ncbi:enoyl-CoA hydratase-related protein [Pseudidiomarina andamanensis]|uniref:Enoyl-CoA hydratase n=1 Tax=Pseudidiomarina andamanensis TaxID=1940690 RepID=A0AA92IL48_9GAMM|nr:enoyl-CoA hydratase-related protein [Pseudidiomarina andamanensis]MDS0218028.1 enoyl-CoA hydratase-related protein [Pseudidiomarina andamanensis]QGT94919.1 enoyl-CoA hydratase [Pseudidiomarina andamanensis]
MSNLVKEEVRHNVLWLTLARPEKKNALTQDMYTALSSALQAADRDSKIAAVVLTGEGDSFTAGNDLNDFLAIEELDDSAPPFEFLYTLSRLSVPLVAGVNGLAIGIGTTILLHCDLVYASNDAVFALPFINLGLVPEAASSLLLPQQCGHLKASELLLLGDNFDAHAALSYGLVNKVVAPDELQDTLEQVALALASKPHGGLRAAKKLIKQPAEPVADRIEREAKIFARALSSEAARQAIKDRLNKKK